MTVFFLCLILFSLVPLASAQQPERIPRIGVLVNGNPASHKFIIDEFQQGLHDLGYSEGKNVFLDYRYAEGKLERLSDLVRELVQRNIDLIFTQATPGTVAAKKVTSSIPLRRLAYGSCR